MMRINCKGHAMHLKQEIQASGRQPRKLTAGLLK